MEELTLPYLEGQTAFLSGLDKSANPYPVGYAEWCKWATGWQYECDQAQQEVSDGTMRIASILLRAYDEKESE